MSSSNFQWIKEFKESEDIELFIVEFSDTVRDIHAGIKSPDALEDLLYQWEHSADALRDVNLRKAVSIFSPNLSPLTGE